MSELRVFDSIIKSVRSYVRHGQYAYIVPECLLVVLMGDGEVCRLVEAVTRDSDASGAASAVREEVSRYIDENVPHCPPNSRIIATPAFNRVFQSALGYASMRGTEPGTLDLLCALFEDKEQASAYFLGRHGITEEAVLDYMEKGKQAPSAEESVLSKYSVDLCELAKQGRIDPLIGRDWEVERLVQILSKKRNANPLLVGREGTGKSAVVEGLAMRIVRGEVAASMKGKHVVALDMTGLVAGTKYRGEFEDRLQKVLKEVSSRSDVILFLDEIHTICGAGGTTEGALDASNILKPYLSRGEIHVIGATTYDEYKKTLEKDKAFARRFKKIDICEPSSEETLQIMQGLRKRYEAFHGVHFPDEVLARIVALSGQYLFDKCYPDKAIDVMDELGARYRSGLSHGEVVTLKDVEDVICRMAHIPEITVEDTEKERLKTLSSRIKENLFGNDEIVDSVVRKICMAKAGIANKGKPVFTGLLCGATGCGKTEFAKQLAVNLGAKLVRLNMSEYSEEYSTSKLIGSAAGYVGYEQAGALTEPLIQNPNAVVLLDEIEKAHESVYNLLLQVLDEGQLTDNHGREASFRNAVILMTSNVGVAESERVKAPLGFADMEGNTKEDRKQEVLEKGLKDRFSPEFRNRLTNVFYFNPICRKTLLQIVDKNLRRLNESLADKKVSVTLSRKARELFADRAAQENAGGRPVERLIDAEVSEKVANEILFGQLEKGGTVTVDVKRKAIVLTFACAEQS